MEVYFLSAVRSIRLVTPIMEAQGGGAIVNISSAWVFEPAAMFPTSAVFRAGLASFAKMFADAYAAKNVRMNNVLPGWIATVCQRPTSGATACRWSAMAGPKKSPPPLLSCCPMELPTSPARTSVWTED
jgi:NAD(P)-dependent dehydrogenase (short-subunit alcohol dehydrogenase family)